MIPISVGTSGSLSNGVAQNEEPGANIEEDAFSDWPRSHPEPKPAKAVADVVSPLGSGPVVIDFSRYEYYEDDPQQPHGPMPSIEISLSTSARQLLLSPSPVSLDISAHEIAPTFPSSNDLPSATSVFSQPFDDLSLLATQSTHEVESEDAIAISTQEFLASVPEVQDNKAIDVPTSREVCFDNVGEHALAAWLSSFSEFDTEEDSEELYSAIQSDPVHAEPDPNDECHAPTALTSSRVHTSADSAREESNGGPGPSLVSSPSASHVPTPLPQDPPPSSSESLSSYSVSVTSLSISSSSLFVPLISLSSSRSSLYASSASIVSLHNQVPLPPSLSLSSLASALSLPSVSLSVCDPSPVSRLTPVPLSCTSVSNVSLFSSRSTKVCSDDSVAHVSHVDAVQPSPTERPPEDPPPDVADELRDWLHDYTILGIEESSPPSLSNPSSLPGAFDEMPECPTPTDDLSTRRHTTFQAPRTASSLAPRTTTVNSALLSASCPLPTFSDSGEFPGFVLPTDEFEMDPLPSSDDIENSPICSHDSYSTFPASQPVWSHPHPCVQPVHSEVNNDDEQDYRSLDFPSSVIPSSTSFDDLRPTPGYSGDLLSPAVGLENDVLSLCFQESRDVVHVSRSDSVLSSRVDALALSLQPSFAQPPHDAPSLDEELSYATYTSPSAACPAELSPVDEYNPQSEPKPPDPSCASH